MKDWIPLLQSAIWPTIIVFFLLLSRKWVIELLDAIVTRIKKGDPFQAGPFGFGKSIPQDSYSKADAGNSKEQTRNSTEKFSFGAYPEMPTEIRKIRVIRLLHKIGPWSKDRDGYTRRDVIVLLETSPESLMKIIEKVTYYLPESWPKKLRIKETSNRESKFQLKTRAYGEVTVGAKVEFTDGTAPLLLNRYCNFYDRE